MDSADYRKLFDKIVNRARRMGYLNDAEDCAHDVLISWLNGRRGQSIAFGVIDSMRSLNGRKPRSVVSYKEKHSPEFDPWDKVNATLDIDSFLRIPDLNRRELQVVELYLRGNSQKEIAEMLNLSESIISRDMQSIIRKKARYAKGRTRPGTSDS